MESDNKKYLAKEKILFFRRFQTRLKQLTGQSQKPKQHSMYSFQQHINSKIATIFFRSVHFSLISEKYRVTPYNECKLAKKNRKSRQCSLLLGGSGEVKKIRIW